MADDRTCPFCERPMRAGTVNVRRSTMGALVLGGPGVGVHVYFQHEGSTKEEIAFRHTDDMPAWLCGDCGSLLVRGHFAEE